VSEKAIAIDIHDAPPFADLLERVAAGEEIVFQKDGKLVARLVPFPADIWMEAWIEKAPAKPRVAGLHEGQGWSSEDFDAPLPDEFWAGRV
jgi:antitoxin (DNA-binding transcriptional repressor) of toxin-antitoxin stability system